MTTETNWQDELEQMVDKFGLCVVVNKLADICGEKAQHIETNWQDKSTAKRWTRACRVFIRAYDNLKAIQGL